MFCAGLSAHRTNSPGHAVPFGHFSHVLRCAAIQPRGGLPPGAGYPRHDVPFAVHFFQGNKLVLLELNGEFISAWDNIASKLAGIQGAAPPLGVKNFRVK